MKAINIYQSVCTNCKILGKNITQPIIKAIIEANNTAPAATSLTIFAVGW